jgi:NAD(P)-dependent dehydrogenase (short-subunit alcohol dehydrogenase family)
MNEQNLSSGTGSEMRDKVVVITGASDGIGAIAARMLSARGAEVVVVGRSPEKTKAVADNLHAKYYLADFTKLDEVRALAKQLQQNYKRIDVLINNAGGIFGTRELTNDGHEKTLQVNYLAPFLLTNLLLDTLISSKATVINVASRANYKFANLNINDLDLKQGFSANRAYGNAKLANILFTQELHKRYAGKGINAVALHPGDLATNFANDTTSLLRFVYRSPLAKIFLEKPEKGAERLVRLASGTPGKDWRPGQYYDNNQPGKIHKQASEPGIAEKLWETSHGYIKPQDKQMHRAPK